MKPLLLVMPTLLLGVACNGEIYLQDGVTDGDTFYLAERALTDNDPVLQSWVSYSLALSTCQLAIGGDNPARASSFDCELLARRHLAEAWQDGRQHRSDDYLDALVMVVEAGWLPEYVATNFARRHWVLPADANLRGYRDFAHAQLRGHRPVTRLIGSWNYARNVRGTY